MTESGGTIKTIEENVENNIHKVVHYRKRCPNICRQYLSKKIKLEHLMLEKTIILNETSKDNESIESVQAHPFDPDIDPKIAENIAALQEKASNLIKVFDQIKSEATCPIIEITDF